MPRPPDTSPIRPNRTIARLASFALPLLITTAQLLAAPPSTAPIQAGCEIDYPPFCIVDENGNADGFSVELLRAALEAVGREVQFQTGTWSEVKSRLATGQIQALPLVGRTPEREDLFDFTFPYMTLRGTIVVRDDTTDIQTLADLRGRRVAVMKGDNSEEFLRRQDRGIDLQTTPTFKQALQELADGHHDAVLIQHLLAVRLLKDLDLDNLQIVKQPVDDFEQEFCFAVTDGDSETLALINEGLALIIANGVYQRLHVKWFAQMELPTHRPVIVGGDHNFPPFEYLDENGRPAGYNVDITRAIAKNLNLPVEIRLGPWNKIVEQLENGEIDVLQGMFYSPERNEKFDFSQPHVAMHYVAVTRKNETKPPANLAQLKNKHIVIRNGDIMHGFAVENNLTDHLAALESQEDALRELAEGRHDCALVSRITALFLIKQHNWDNLQVGDTPILSPKYCFAVKKGQKAMLATFAEGLGTIEQSGEYHAIQDKWFGIHGAVGWPQILRKVAPFAIPLILVVLVVTSWSWSLRKLVKIRTRELKQSKEHIAHLNEVLRVIRDVNQLIVRKQKRDTMIAQACQLLVKSSTYTAAMILLVDDNLKPVAWFQAGGQECTKEIDALKQSNHLPACCKQNLASTPITTTVDNNNACRDCPVETPKNNVPALCVRIEHDQKVFGFMLIYSVGNAINQDEENLFTELANDIGFALRSIDTEQAHNQSETERKNLQTQVTQMQKLEAVGRLAGGVAHDFNNMLSIIVGNAELILEDMPEDNPMHEYIQEIMNASKKSIQITRQLLAFARRQNVSPKVTNLNEAVENSLQMLRRLIGEDIDLAWLPSTKTCPIKIDPTQIDQLLANLCVNARDAIEDIGKITIETLTATFDEEYCKNHLDFSPGTFAMLAVSDNGCGMAPETMENLFEPFFTTKSVDKGTGLGLATVYGIVKQNNGFISVYSEPGQGSTFKIYLPCCKNEPPPPNAQAKHHIPMGHGETILLVEDNQAILKTACQILENLGYQALTASTAKQALEIAKTHTGEIELLITDVIMPEMNGRDLANQIEEAYPNLKILFMSGYTDNVIAHHGILEDGIQFIQKPFAKEELAEKITEILTNS